MKKWYFVFVFALTCGLIFFALKAGVGPSPIGIMKPSFFDQPEEIGAVVFRRLYAPIINDSVVVFGVPPNTETHQKVVEGFLRAAETEQKPFTLVLLEDGMPQLRVPAHISTQNFRFNDDPQVLKTILDAEAAKGGRSLIYTANTLSTHILTEGPIRRFEAVWGRPVLSITTGILVLRAALEYKIDPPCVGIARDTSGTANLGCIMLSKGRRHYRKHLPMDRLVAVMDRHGAFPDHLLLISDRMAEVPETASLTE